MPRERPAVDLGEIVGHRARPQPVLAYDVHLGRDERHLCRQVHPREEPDDDTEEPVERARVLERTRDVEVADGLEDRPGDTGEDRTGNDIAPRDVGDGQYAEGDEEDGEENE